MFVKQGSKSREILGPTPYSVAVVAKAPPSRPSNYLTIERRKQDAAREKGMEFIKYQRTCDLKSTWERNTHHRILLGTIERGVKDAMDQYNMDIDYRRDKLRDTLETEEQELLIELESKQETVLERQAKMRERAKQLRERRECERQQVVQDKLEQLFVEQSEELRTVEAQRRQTEVCLERAAQLQTRQEMRRQQQGEEQIFADLWENDRKAKEERENQQAQLQRQRNLQQLGYLQAQMDAAEQQRQQAKMLKEEEGQLLREQREMQRLEQQRGQSQKLKDQENRRLLLDQCLRLKMRRLARQQQDELALDMSILKQLLTAEKDEKKGASQRKLTLREEEARYRQYLANELEEHKREEAEAEQLMEVELQRTWAQRAEKTRLQKEARDRLMKEVMTTRVVQIQEKLDFNKQKQDQLEKDREQLNKTLEEYKLLDEEQKKRVHQATQEYQVDLLAQIKHQQKLKEQDKAQAEKEHLQGLAFQEEYNTKMRDILSRPISHTKPVHPFRRREVSSAQPRL